MASHERTVEKAYAYVTRDGCTELLVFEEAGKTGLQVPKGTVESGEDPERAVVREVDEEAGLDEVEAVEHLATDDWDHRTKPKTYRRHFFHVTVPGAPDSWTHAVTGEGEDAGDVYDYEWRPLSSVDLTDDMDAHLERLDG